MKTVIYIHGKGGSIDEAKEYAPLFEGYETAGIDYKSETPYQAREEFSELYDKLCGKSDEVILIANSIGAYFAMHSLSGKRIKKAFFISPIVDMEGLIENMMKSAGVSESELKEQGEISTSFGQTLSWEYLCFVRDTPIKWSIPTDILYGSKDDLTSYETIAAFCEKTGARLTVMQDGEHWFHTDEQMRFLKKWIIRNKGS